MDGGWQRILGHVGVAGSQVTTARLVPICCTRPVLGAPRSSRVHGYDSMKRTTIDPRKWAVLSAVCALGLTSFHSRGRATAPEADVLEVLLRALDADRDGSLAPFEAAEAALTLVRHADANGDGVATSLELAAWLDERSAERSEEATELVTDLDEDGDGSLSVEELPEELEPFMDGVDADGDGVITVSEVVAAEPFESARPMIEAEFFGVLEELDEDGDGSFRIDELGEDIDDDAREWLAQLDVDSDGQVTRAEVSQRIDEELRGAQFEVDGRVARMSGVIGPSTPGRVLELIVESPDVQVIELVHVPGSMDDEANLRASRMLHRAGLRTRVAVDGEIASGGVDFFLAGHDRVVGTGGRLGVHSWATGGGETGRDLERSHPDHGMFLDFYRDVDVDPEFYWFTLEAAPADDIHWMTDEEVRRFDAGELEGSEEESDQATHIGGCVLIDASGAVPADPFEVTALRSGEDLAPFGKTITGAGIELRAEAGVSDEFLKLTAAACAEIFREAKGKDRDMQRAVTSAMHARRALLPVPRTEESFEELLGSAEGAVEAMEQDHSVCDIIMSEVPADMQVMEVVEHLLHTITDVGLATVFPEDWGLERTSTLGQAMDQAIEAGHYHIDGYEDLAGAPTDILDRVLIQEFAYWYLTTRWDLQRPYGPDEEEWTLRTPDELRAAFPVFDAVVERTAGAALSSPTPETLTAIAKLARRLAEQREK